MPAIVKLGTPSPEDLTELEDIFFESSSKKDFRDEAERRAFFEKYLGVYLRRFPEFFWVARDERILGYMAGAPLTLDPELEKLQPHLLNFKDYLPDYPAHLHVNLHRDARGLGLGSKLFSELEDQLQGMKIRGIHIMTGPDSRNKSFYEKLGFNFQKTLSFQGGAILFMGKSL